jgi:GT2 family glycosyltransferase
MAPALVSVVIVNWNRRIETLACLASVTRSAYPACEIVVVDNGSCDGSIAAIHAAYPQVHVIDAQDNTGFVGGCNRGVERARARDARYVMFLNNDAEIAPDAMTHLIAACALQPHAGAVGPTVYYADRRQTVWSAGGRIHWARGATEMLGLDATDDGQFGRAPRPVDFVSGCVFLTPLAVIDRIGGFDPRFFAYYEETEWCVRAARAGYKILHVPLAHAWHRAAPSTQPASLLTHYYMTRNRLLFLALTGAGLSAWCQALGFDYLRTLLSWTVRPKWRSRRPHREVMLRAIADYYRGRLGRAPWVEHLPALEGQTSPPDR